ncbi:hypothetical protein RBA41_06560 [Massilia sp. CCM 9210]|uniref:hypothetical protein n=1 Tax=Massilia scottii TaxID=3057166 RepID=UPI0027967C52|nr:hypothetical protein [Massilia sp. CCM 9210]MDQ1812963.1 hypothetical protein [Massilia sp. CCM 9210]
MAKHTHPPKTIASTTQEPPPGSPVSQRTTASGKQMTVVTLGNVTVEVPTPSASELKKRLAESQRVMRAFAAAIPRRGVRLNLPPTTPLYEADSKDPNLVIRKLGETRTLGRFDKNGRFIQVKR